MNEVVPNSSQLEPIKIVVRRNWDGVVIEAARELDLASVATFTGHYESTLTHLSKMIDSQSLTLDLKNVTFIDSAGLALLMRISQEVSDGGHRCVVIVRELSQLGRVIKVGRFFDLMNIIYA